MVLIVAGTVFLLDQLGIIAIEPIGHWWPGILVVMGVIRIVAPEARRQIASGVTFVLLGLWFFACTRHWHGLGYHNAWPLLLVIIGAEIVLGAALDRLPSGAVEQEPPHA
ncbi:MAG TPA: DUF5668 domain-containing protein [Candidatus Eisenbacteria bacterium]